MDTLHVCTSMLYRLERTAIRLPSNTFNTIPICQYTKYIIDNSLIFLLHTPEWLTFERSQINHINVTIHCTLHRQCLPDKKLNLCNFRDQVVNNWFFSVQFKRTLYAMHRYYDYILVPQLKHGEKKDGIFSVPWSELHVLLQECTWGMWVSLSTWTTFVNTLSIIDNSLIF